MRTLRSASVLACLCATGCVQPASTPEAPALDVAVYERMMARLWETGVDVDFDDMSLEEAFAFIEERSGLDMRVQWRDLDEAGVDPDTSVTLKLRDVALAEVLDAVLESVGEPGEWSLGYEPALVLLVSTGDTLPERPEPIETTRYNDATYKASGLGRIHPTRDPSTPSGVYIPKDLED